MKKTAIILNVLFLLSIFITPQVACGAEAGEATAQVLQMGAGARLPAMGGAGQASVSGPAALTYNPAGLAMSSGRELEFTYQEIIEDISYGNFDYIQPKEGMTRAAGLRYISYGSEDETDWTGGTVGNDLEKTGSFDGADIVVSGGLAGNLSDNVTLGVATRIIHLTIADEDAKGLSMDAGLQWQSPDEKLPVTAGVVVQNFGPDITFDQKDEDLPLLVRAGGSLFLEPLIDRNITLHTDVDYHQPASETYLRAGGEWKFYKKMLAVRLGYDGGLEVDDGLTLGFGVNLPNRDVSFDYSLVPYGDFGDVHRLAFNYYFGGK